MNKLQDFQHSYLNCVITDAMDNKITFIEHTEITTKEEWEKVTEDVESDNHQNSYSVQLQYCNRAQNFSPDTGFMMVNDHGEVCANGNKDDVRTFFDVVHDFQTGRYFIVCRGGKYKDYVLYMTGSDLKTKKFKSSHRNEKDTTIFFSFLSQGNQELPPWKIQSYSGVPIQFDNHGRFLTEPPGKDYPDYSDPYYFYAYKAYTVKYTSV